MVVSSGEKVGPDEVPVVLCVLWIGPPIKRGRVERHFTADVRDTVSFDAIISVCTSGQECLNLFLWSILQGT